MTTKTETPERLEELEDFMAIPDGVDPMLRVAQLQELLTSLYVAVLGHLFDIDGGSMWPAAVDDVLDTVLAAGEGRSFEPLELPWPK